MPADPPTASRGSPLPAGVQGVTYSNTHDESTLVI
jgi:hypothetical protein